MKTILILILSTLPIAAGDYCYYPVVVEKEKVTVINRQLNIAPILGKPDKNEEKLALAVVDQVFAAIPISPKVDYLRTFKFVKNWPVVAAQKQVAVQKIETQTVTKILYGQIQQSIIIKDGHHYHK